MSDVTGTNTGRDAFLLHLWTEVIDPHTQPDVLSVMASDAQRDPHAPFADAGLAAKALLDAGSSPVQLGRLMRGVAYEAVFQTLYALDDPGLEDHESTEALFEDLLGADPSGREGRPETK